MTQEKPPSDNDLIAALAEALSDNIGKEKTTPETQGVVTDERYAFLRNPLWPEAKWDVSGAFVYAKVFTAFQTMLTQITGMTFINWVHGAPLCLWNGGRVKINVMTKDEILNIIFNYADISLPVEITFSNTLIEKEHLDDVTCNGILECLVDKNPSGENGVIICSELIREHVDKVYPSLNKIASVVKIAHEDGKGDLDYYRRLEERYDRIMIHPDDNFNLDLLEKIKNKDRYEILVNEPCVKNCQVRKRHYELLSKLSLNLLDSKVGMMASELRQNNGCHNLDDLFFSDHRRTLLLSDNEIKSIYDLGFRNFKIQGRGMTNEGVMMVELFRLLLNNSPDINHITARLMHRLVTGG